MTNNSHQPIQKLLELIGFENFNIEANDEGKISISIYDDAIKNAARFLPDLETAARLVAKKNNLFVAGVDINNYRKERERLVELPPMNAYERRLVHVELASRPDVKTESVGEGATRRVSIQLL
ncbi:MAG: Single-stranded nucleic acid binding R3H domain protein [Parcubacteria group bacterium GW2011_GWB1_45_9]|nr:MAG: Single-stranded nucleic acid binding R3H domain protein [Parcubacteria group bacterium GW2011_GWB1_45_9]